MQDPASWMFLLLVASAAVLVHAWRLRRRVRELQWMVECMAARIAGQSDLLSKKAEKIHAPAEEPHLS